MKGRLFHMVEASPHKDVSLSQYIKKKKTNFKNHLFRFGRNYGKMQP